MEAKRERESHAFVQSQRVVYAAGVVACFAHLKPARTAITFLWSLRSKLHKTPIDTVGDDFSVSREVIAPPTLRVLRRGFLLGFRGTHLDFSETQLLSVGDDFLADSSVEELLLLPPFKGFRCRKIGD